MTTRVRHRLLSPLALVLAIAGGCATGTQSTSLTRMDVVRIADARSDSTPSRFAVVVRYVDRPAVPVEGAQVRRAEGPESRNRDHPGRELGHSERSEESRSSRRKDLFRDDRNSSLRSE